MENLAIHESSDEDSVDCWTKGGYDEQRTEPTRESTDGWPVNTHLDIREADAAAQDPEAQQHSKEVEVVLAILQPTLLCVECRPFAKSRGS